MPHTEFIFYCFAASLLFVVFLVALFTVPYYLLSNPSAGLLIVVPIEQYSHSMTLKKFSLQLSMVPIEHGFLVSSVVDLNSTF